MMNIIEIEGVLVAGDILTEPFECDLRACRGACCVEGDAGAPLEYDEPDILAHEYPNYQQFMTQQGREAVEREGFFQYDEEGEPTTTLFAANAACAYSYNKDGITFCAIEEAFLAGQTEFRKPVSCHLYPVRVKHFSDGSLGLNYHRWAVCRSAVECGARSGTPIYIALREPLVRRFGEQFYAQLKEAAKWLTASEMPV